MKFDTQLSMAQAPTLHRSRSLLMLVLIVLGGRCLSASDRVWLEPQRPTNTESDWYPRAVEQLDGRVIDLDDKQLRFLRSGDEAETIVAAERVLWIEPEQVSDLQAELIALFKEGQHAQSLLKLPNTLQQRPPVWRQQFLTMLASTSAWKSGRNKISLELVSQLDRRPLPPMALAWLPIAWRGGRPSVDAMTQAGERLNDPSPLVQLAAASWLLSSPQRSEAIAVLTQLKNHQREVVSSLAEVLMWRTATPPQVTQSAETWRAKVEELPMVLQTGPVQTLIEKLRTAGQAEMAQELEWSLEMTPSLGMSLPQ